MNQEEIEVRSEWVIVSRIAKDTRRRAKHELDLVGNLLELPDWKLADEIRNATVRRSASGRFTAWFYRLVGWEPHWVRMAATLRRELAGDVSVPSVAP